MRLGNYNIQLHSCRSLNITVVNGCTSGFMELNLLRKRAEKITNNADTNEDSLDEEFRLLPDESFSCSGTMTGLLFVGTYRTGGGRNLYPEIQIWRNSGSNTYTRQGSEMIELAAGVFSPDGVLQYNLTTPISYQSGDVLGVYQPKEEKSVVRVYYESSASTTYRMNQNNPKSPINLTDLSPLNDKIILTSPISGKNTSMHAMLNALYNCTFFQTHYALVIS